MSFLGELKRRDVVKVAAAYLLAAWLVVQVVGVLTDPLSLPDWFDTVVVVLLAIGFPFALVIAWVYEVTPEGLKVTTAADSSKDARSPVGRRLTYLLIALVVIVAGFTALNSYDRNASVDAFGPGSRLAVLPCDDLSPDPSNSFFAVGIHEELLNRLSALSALDVISRTSVLRYAGSRPPIPQIATELDVDAIIECSARYAGDRVLLTVQLIDGSSDSHLWSDTYPADMSDLHSLFDIEADLAMDVANELNVKFLGDELQQIEQVPTESREAYELYLSALALNGTLTYGGLDEGLRLTEAAIALDPRFADAWALKATYHGLRSYAVATDNRAGERKERREAALRAIELNPSLAAAHIALAGVLASDGDWIGSEASYRRALQLNRSLVFDSASPWVQRMAVADFQDAHTLLEAMRRDDPLNPTVRAFLVLSYDLLGDAERAEREFASANRLFPNGLQLWYMTVVRLGTHDDVNLDDIEDAWLIDGLGRELLSSPEEGLETLHRLYAEAETMPDVLAQQYAQWAAFWGDAEFALEIMESIVRPDAQNAYYFWPANMREVRQLPGFRSLMEDIGIVDYWKEFGWPDICRPLEGGDFVCD